MGNAGWHPDPLARHQLRYFDGEQWTPHVVDGNDLSFDPLAASTSDAGATTPARTGAAPKRTHARGVQWIVVGAVVVAAAVALGAVAFASSSKTSTKRTTVHASFALVNAFAPLQHSEADGSVPCVGDAAHSDVNLRMPVAIDDNQGRELTRTQIGLGRVVGNACVFRFTFAVEKGAPYYVVSVGRRASNAYTFAELQTPDAVALVLAQ
jgi:hypothetical protein